MKRILVTGASRGLGEAIARLLDGLGHRVVLHGRDATRLDTLQSELTRAEVVSAELSSVEAAERLATETLEVLGGGLDALINCAGSIEPIAFLEQSDLLRWAETVTVNLLAPTALMKALLPALRQSHGRIVNISTGAAVKPMPGWGAYCASKAGLLQLTSVVALEAPELGCFSLRPGVIDTDMQEVIRKSSGMREADQKRFLELHDQGRLEPPEVPGRAAVWLALHGPKERSGELIEYTDEQVVAGVKTLFPAMET